MNYVTTLAAGGKLLLLEAFTGILHICEASPAGYTEISAADVLAGVKSHSSLSTNGVAILFASPPVLVAERIYCRNVAGDLVCIDASRK
jgi:hypothetical protein